MAENRKIKFDLVGCGKIGARHLAVIDKEERADIGSICDIDESRMKALADTYGGIRSYADHKKMIDDSDADVICVCTPHALHAEMTIYSANAKKHVLVEKPMALTVKDCEAMNNAASENGVKLYVVKQNRYNVPVNMAKDLLDEGRLGKIFMVKCDVLWNRYEGYYSDSDWRGNKELEGGALFTQASHFIDLLVWWFGEVKEAIGFIDTKGHKIEIEDCGNALINFSSGTMGSITWTTCVYDKNYEGSITIIGEKGTIKIGGEYLNKIVYWDVDGYPIPEGIDFNDRPNNYEHYQGTSSNHDKVFDALIGSLLNEDKEIVEGIEGIKSIEAIEKIYSAIGDT